MPWDKLLEEPTPQGHLVQFHGADDRFLVSNVARYLREGLNRGDGAIVIATEAHVRAFDERLRDAGSDVPTAREQGRLAFYDAHEILAKFMVGGKPDWDRFESVVGTAMAKLRSAANDAKANHAKLRAYGEMVGVLWKTRQFSAAIRLEQFWNKLLSRSSFSLYCAYSIDIFGQEFQVAALDSILCTHTHLVPCESDGAVETAICQALEEILGSGIDDLRIQIKANRRAGWGVMPAGENTALWVRSNLPRKAEEIMRRAREHYEALRQRPLNQASTHGL
jgi:superfamily I DNA/RNA helicase